MEFSSALILQLIWNGLVSGAMIALVALGLAIIFGVAGFIQFAHGEIVAFGAYFFMMFHKVLGWPFIPAGVAAVGIMVVMGILLEKLFFRPIRHHDPLVPLVVSIGLSILFQSIILIIWGASVRTITDQSFTSIPLLGGKILATPSQIWAILTSILLVIGLILFLQKTKIGKAIRAVSSSRNLAQVFGINVDTTMKWVFGLGAALAGVSGIFLGFEQNLEPLMGVTIGIKAFSAIILGAVGSVRGAIVGAFLIGMAESLLVGLDIVPSGFASAIPFLILILMLLFRPEGLFGKRFEILRQ